MNELHDLENRLKKRTAADGCAIGSFLLSGSAFVAEVMASQALDWMVIDMEASHASKEDLLHVLQALNAYRMTPIVRVPAHDAHYVESSLDFGAKGIMVPKVNTRAQAEAVTGACFYPPKGTRGVNCIRASAYYTRAAQYLKHANEATTAIVQIESAEAVENALDIARLPNVDALFLGLGDLAASLGQMGVVTGRLMDDARQRVLEACRLHGKIPGIFAHDVSAANQYLHEGFKLVAIGNDVKFLSVGLTFSLGKLEPRSAGAPRAE